MNMRLAGLLQIIGLLIFPALRVYAAAPVVKSTTYTFAEGKVHKFPISASDADGDVLTMRVVRYPANGTVSYSTIRKQWTYTPSRDFFGNDYFILSASDATATTEGRIDFKVTPVNDAPRSAVWEQAMVLDKEEFEIQASAGVELRHALAVTDPEGDNFEIILGKKAKKGLVKVFGVGSGEIAYLPNGDASGVDNFSVRLRDSSGALSEHIYFSANISAAPRPPVAVYEPSGLEILESGSLIGVEALNAKVEFYRNYKIVLENRSLVSANYRISFENQNFVSSVANQTIPAQDSRVINLKLLNRSAGLISDQLILTAADGSRLQLPIAVELQTAAVPEIPVLIHLVKAGTLASGAIAIGGLNRYFSRSQTAEGEACTSEDRSAGRCISNRLSRFYLADVREVVVPEGSERHADIDELSTAYAVPGYINLFVVKSLFGDVVGRAQIGGASSLLSPSRYRTSMVIESKYVKTSVPAHEMGHLLGLDHTNYLPGFSGVIFPGAFNGRWTDWSWTDNSLSSISCGPVSYYINGGKDWGSNTNIMSQIYVPDGIFFSLKYHAPFGSIVDCWNKKYLDSVFTD